MKQTSFLGRLSPFFPVILCVVGLVAICLGIGFWTEWYVGLISGGIACFILEWRISG